MDVRKPAVAGQFYDDNPDLCLGELQECLLARSIEMELPGEIVAGIVPHPLATRWTSSWPWLPSHWTTRRMSRVLWPA